MSRQALNRHLAPMWWLVCSAMLAAPVAAQTPRAAGEAPEGQPRVGPVRQSDIEIYRFRSASGELLPVPSVSFEELQELKLLKEQLMPRATAPERFTLQEEIQFTGTADRLRAQLDVQIKLQLRAAEEEQQNEDPTWVRIPLRMNQAILLPAADHTGTGQFLLSYERNGDGYVGWLRAPPGSQHTLKLKVKVPLVRAAGKVRVALVTPAGPTTIQLAVPGDDLEVASNNEETNIVSTRPGQPGTTRIDVENSGGRLELTWREKKPLPPALEALGSTVRVTLNGNQRDYDVTLRVRSFAPVPAFEFTLPPGVELKGHVNPGLEVTVVGTSPADARQRVRVTRQDGKPATSFEVQLQAWTVLPRDTAAPLEQIELAGFEVLDAIRQSGSVHVSVQGDWTVDWFPGDYVRPVATSPALRQEGVVASFAYDRQPHSLKAEIQKRESRVSVEPLYVLHVEAQQLRLEATLKCRISGGRTREIKIRADGWVIDPLPANELVADVILPEETTPPPPQPDDQPPVPEPPPADPPPEADEAAPPPEERAAPSEDAAPPSEEAAPPSEDAAPPSEEPGADQPADPADPAEAPPEQDAVQEAPPPQSPLIIRLAPNSAALSEEFEIRLTAHRQLEAEATSFQATLPRPIESIAAPATVVVLPADNLELTLRADQIRGLVPEQAPPVVELPERQQAPLYYREELSGEASLFAADFTVRQRMVTVAVDSRIRFAPNEISVEQEFDVRIAFEPVSQLQFDVPAELAKPERLLLLLDDKPLTIHEVSEPTGDAGAQRARVTVNLPEDRIKPCTIVSRYQLPGRLRSAGEGTSLRVPLLQVVEDEATSITANKLRIADSDEVSVELMDEGWELLLDPDPLSASAGRQVFQTGAPVEGVAFLATLASSPAQGATLLENVWVQTWQSNAIRRDRACFRLLTNQPRVRLRLPPGGKLMYVAVDGQPRQPSANSDRAISVDLGSSPSPQPHTIELWYWFATRTYPLARRPVTPPEVVGVDQARRIYWQLILPQSEHLLWSSHALTAEYDWRWSQYHWGRRANRSQRELEALLAASAEENTAAGATNQYLFSAVGPLVPVSFITVSRGAITFALSGLVLLVGLLLIYFPALRHPAALLVGAVVVLAVGLAQPEPAILAAQAAVLGIGLVLLARLLQWNAARRRYRRVAYAGSTLIGSDSRLSEEVALPQVDGSSRSASVPTTLHAPAVEPKP